MTPASSSPPAPLTATAIADGVHAGTFSATEAWVIAREAAERAGEPASAHPGTWAEWRDEARASRPVHDGAEQGPHQRRQPSSATRRERARNRIERRRPTHDLRAYTGFLDSEARAAAEFVDTLPADARATLPLAGVPFAVKSNVTLDSPSIRRLLAAGAVPVAMTTTPEFCVWGATDSVSFGVTRNPWNLALTPGGSSGGSAAAVAAGLVPIAHGNDGMGSLRIPAACCGLVTLKPGPGVVPTDIGADNWGGMSEDGVLATTVDDLALATAAMAGDPALAERSRRTGLRIALSLGSPLSLAGRALVRTDKKIVAATRAVGRALEEAGHTVVEADLPYPSSPWPLLARWTTGLDADAAAANFPISRMERRNRHHALVGRLLRGMDIYAAPKKETDAVEGFLDEGAFDLVLTPTLATAPIAADAWNERSWFRSLWANLRYAPFPALFNHIAWPAMSIPAGEARIADVPIGVQLAGRPGTEGLLLDVAAQLERALPWTRTAVGADDRGTPTR